MAAFLEQREKERKELNLLKSSVENVQEWTRLMKEVKECESDGVYLIDTGKCKVINPYDQY